MQIRTILYDVHVSACETQQSYLFKCHISNPYITQPSLTFSHTAPTSATNSCCCSPGRTLASQAASASSTGRRRAQKRGSHWSRSPVSTAKALAQGKVGGENAFVQRGMLWQAYTQCCTCYLHLPHTHLHVSP